MYLDKISQENIIKAEQEVELINPQTLSFLDQGMYDIYYFYEVNRKRVVYVALCKDMKSCYQQMSDPFLAVSVTERGDIEGGQQNGSDSLPLLIYLYHREKNLTEEEKKNLYQEISSITELVEGLSAEDSVRKIEARKEFTTFLKRLDKQAENKPVSQDKEKFQVKLSFQFLPEDVSELQFSISLINQDKTYEIQNLYRFLTGFKTREEFTLSPKKKVLLEANSFLSPYGDALSIIARHVSFYSKMKTSTYGLDTENVAEVFDTIQDELIQLNGKDTRIKSSGNVTFSLDEKGQPLFDPEFKDIRYEIKTIIGKDSVYIFDAKKKEITKYFFPDERIRNTYLYFTSHPMEDFQFIQDLFNEKLLPNLTKSLKAKRAENKNEVKPFEIILYLTIDEEKGLCFKTHYLENGNEVKEITSTLGETMKSAYLSLINSLGGKENGTLKSDEEIIRFISNDLSSINSIATLFCDERLKPQNQKTVSGMRVTLKQKGDFLSLTLDSKDYSKEELEEILKAYHQRRKYFLLKKNFILLQGEELEEASHLFPEGETTQDNVPLYRLFSIGSGKLTMEEDSACKETLSNLKNFASHPFILEEKAKKLIRPYQKEGIGYLLSLYDYGFGGILADEMGLGKTFEAICFLNAIKETKPCLVIVPKAVLYNWENEIHKFSSLRAVVIDSDKETREKTISSIQPDRKVIYLMSYDTFKRDSELFEDIDFATVILDEAQSIKNAFSKRHIALMGLKSRNKIALTGTPLENSPLDLWSIFDILMPGYFGNDKEFTKLIESENGMKRLPLLLKPFLLRRKKEDVLKDLPSKTENNVIISMNDTERMLYLAYLEKTRNLSHENKISILAGITRLRQLCVDPSTFLEEFDSSTKLLYTVSLLKESIENNHKVIIFSSFKQALLHLKDLLDEENIPSLVITGDTSGKDRLAYAETFNSSDEYKVILVSLKAGGVGLNLIGADTVIHLDPWWNPQAENQATDRAHRIGQTKPVTVLRLIMKDTVEEKVLKLQDQKKDIYNEIVENNGGVSSLSDDDISFILS